MSDNRTETKLRLLTTQNCLLGLCAILMNTYLKGTSTLKNIPRKTNIYLK